MLFTRFALVTALAISLAACAPMPPLNFSVPSVGASSRKIPAEMRSMTVTLGRPDERTGELPAGMETSVPQLWQTALTEALNRMAIFQDDAGKKVNLSVKVLKVDVQKFGASMTTQTAARYELLDRSNGDVIFTQDIASEGTTPFDFAFNAIIRQRESVNRAVQNNITQFLQSLEGVDVTKPMFPAKKNARQ